MSTKTETFPNHRKLTVRTSYYDYKLVTEFPSSSLSEPDEVPWINIKGYWLRDADFPIGTPVAVEVNKGRIVLTIGQKPAGGKIKPRS
jgi:toxic protein SymE